MKSTWIVRQLIGSGPAAALAVLVCLAAATPALATICVAPDAGGSVEMPPPAGTAGCTEGYVSPQDFHEITDGLPAGTTIIVGAEHTEFINSTRNQGGNLGGEIETFDSILILNMQGTGALAGFNRNIAMSLQCETHIGPRNFGDPVQTFPNEMVFLQGEIFGDPDFDFLSIRAGTNFGLPSPGQTTLTDLNNGTFNVDSFFDIAYEIEFQGAPGSILEGFGGVTSATVPMQIGEAPPPVPAMTPWGLIGLGAMIAAGLAWMLTRRRVGSEA